MIDKVQTPVEEETSHFLQYLPGFYREDAFISRFLCIFENILKPIENVIGDEYFYFDPGTAPDTVVPWLASWLGMVMDERWPDDKRRVMIKSAAELYRWRGTRRGLSEYLRIYTGVTPKIIEHGQAQGMRLGGGSKLGTPMQIGGKGNIFCFTVELNLPEKSETDIEIIRAIIESQKPAHTAYFLKITGEGAKIG
jgi:phage tail-like protein